MSWDLIVSTGIVALASVAILFIATIGLAVIFGLMGVINLAHGEFLMLGAYITLYATKSGIPFTIAVMIAGLGLALFGVIVERMLVRFLYGRLLDSLLATWGLGMILYQGAVLIFGTSSSGIGLPHNTINVGEYSIPMYYLLMIGVAITLALIVYVVLTKTKYGIMSRAVVQNPAMSQCVGIKSGRLNIITFSLGAALAGIAGGLLVPVFPATPDMGSAFVSKAFLAVIVAGPLAISGTFMSILGLESMANIGATIYTSVIGNIIFFVVTIVLLRLYPLGISKRWRIKI